tara:strand:- start:15659 stop:16129 length:471 start_codon:yes stop_codon:yes gene_type:complete
MIQIIPRYVIIIIFLFSCLDDTDDDTFTTTGGDTSTTTGGDAFPVNILFGSVSDTLIEILINTPYDIAGFQFDISNVILSDASGGLAEEAGFNVSTGESTVLGVSFVGNVIPAGSNGVLTNLSYTATASEFCIDGVVLSNPDANAINYELGDCIEY